MRKLIWAIYVNLKVFKKNHCSSVFFHLGKLENYFDFKNVPHVQGIRWYFIEEWSLVFLYEKLSLEEPASRNLHTHSHTDNSES